MVPGPRRHGIEWWPRHALAAAFDLDGAFSNVALDFAPGTPEDRVIAAVDRLPPPGMAAPGRRGALTRSRIPSGMPS
jgi:putative ABC transport system permease protein